MANQYRSVLASGGASTGGDALPAEVLSGKTFTNDNGAQTGTMVNRGAVSESLSLGESYTIQAGFHNGSGIVSAVTPSEILHVIALTTFAQASLLSNGSVALGDDLTGNDIKIQYANNTYTVTAVRECDVYIPYLDNVVDGTIHHYTANTVIATITRTTTNKESLFIVL